MRCICGGWTGNPLYITTLCRRATLVLFVRRVEAKGYACKTLSKYVCKTLSKYACKTLSENAFKTLSKNACIAAGLSLVGMNERDLREHQEREFGLMLDTLVRNAEEAMATVTSPDAVAWMREVYEAAVGVRNAWEIEVNRRRMDRM